MKNLKIRIGRRMKKARLEMRLTQEELAEKLDVTSSYIGMLERGERYPSLQMLEKVSDVLGVPIGALTDEEKKEPSSVFTHKLNKAVHKLEPEQIEAISNIAETMAKYSAKKQPRPCT